MHVLIFLAKHGAKNHDLFKAWDILPPGLNSLLMADSSGTNFEKSSRVF
jgi:hypothetical protein